MADFMTLKFQRRSDENTESRAAMTVRDKAPVVINILLMFYCGNSGDEKRFQIVTGQIHIQGYLHFYLHFRHSATMINFLAFL
jgi:hypothetical protein